MPKNKDYHSLKPWTSSQERFGKWAIKRMGKLQTTIYELTGGRLWNKFLGGDCAILTTIGNKSGLPRKTPLLYLEHENAIVMVASQGGFSTLPLWYKNLCSNPEAIVQIGAKKRTMIARTATEAEKEELWPRLDAIYAGYKEYRARTYGVRDIPIIIFTDI